MSRYMEYLLIALACMVVLLIGALRRKLEWLLNFVMRGVLGAVAIYFINMVLHTFGVSTLVGVNFTSVLTSAFLGIPGIAALYGIAFYHSL